MLDVRCLLVFEVTRKKVHNGSRSYLTEKTRGKAMVLKKEDMERARVEHAASRLLDALDRLFTAEGAFPEWRLTFGGAAVEIVKGEKKLGRVAVKIVPHDWLEGSHVACEMEIQEMDDIVFWRPSECSLSYASREPIIWDFEVVEWGTKVIFMPTNAPSMITYNKCLGHRL